MTRKELEAVIEEGTPFTLRLADGKSYEVPHRDYISLPPKNAIVAVVYEDDGTVHVLKLAGLNADRRETVSEGTPNV